MIETVCGIDFGTTNSTIGVIKENRPQMIKIEDNKITIPTALFFEEKKNHPLFGQAAINRYIQGDEGRFIRSIKRILGTDLMEKFTTINGKGRRFDELILLFLAHLKNNAEKISETTISSAVIGRPVHFQNDDPKADQAAEDKLRSIAQKVGFKNIIFQYEPIAAAFSHERFIQDEKLALVVDLGGGTSDFTIIRLGADYAKKTDRKDDILATSGVRIGGNDFDKALSMKSFMPQFGKGSTYGDKKLQCPLYLFSELSEWSKINFAYTPQNHNTVQNILYTAHEPEKIERLLDLLDFQEAHRLLQVVEDTKIDLTQQEIVSTYFSALSEKIYFDADKKSFEEVIKSDVDKIEKSMKECLELANLKADDINLVILTGGSCEIPYVAQTFKNLFPQAVFSEKEKLLSVGYGLTEMAGKVF